MSLVFVQAIGSKIKAVTRDLREPCAPALISRPTNWKLPISFILLRLENQNPRTECRPIDRPTINANSKYHDNKHSSGYVFVGFMKK